MPALQSHVVEHRLFPTCCAEDVNIKRPSEKIKAPECFKKSLATATLS